MEKQIASTEARHSVKARIRLCPSEIPHRVVGISIRGKEKQIKMKALRNLRKASSRTKLETRPKLPGSRQETLDQLSASLAPGATPACTLLKRVDATEVVMLYSDELLGFLCHTITLK